ncbi:MAG TPA: S8 family serine peptidase [Candidatus Kapabacteria bacterium]|nr:S8 family serine peptidase [Candidatus Kapabacteria bacterium]
MKFILIYIICSLSFVYAKDYYTIWDSSNKLDKIAYIYQDNENYLKSSFFIKTKTYIDINDLKNQIYNILTLDGYYDFKINKIERPFGKYLPNLLKKNKLSSIYSVTFDSKYDIYSIAKLLQASNEFEYVVPKRIYKLSAINSNDPLNNMTNYLDSMQVNDIWKIIKGDSSIAVGIVDSGVFLNNLDLVNNIKINHNEIPNDGKDNDNNGFIDDYYGWDFIGNISSIEAADEKFKPDNDVVPAFKTNNHGTHVAGICSAETNNSTGIASLAYNISYIPVKITIDNIAISSDVIKPFEGILYALNRGAKVINCSWLSDEYNPLAQDIADYVVENGSIIVCAAGNFDFDNGQHPNITPANLNNVITVGAIKNDRTLTSFSNYGWGVDIFAPGYNIYSTIQDNQYDVKSGTSMASPIITSLVALIKLIHPTWNYKQIVTHLRTNALPIRNIVESDTSKYWGAVNAVGSLRNNYIENYHNPIITIQDYYLEDTKYLDLIEKERNLNIELYNYTSKATNVSLELIPLVSFVELNQKHFNFSVLDSNKSFNLELKIKLSSSVPYFEGDIPILVILKADNFKNLEVLHIPFKLETSTRFLIAQKFKDGNYNIWKTIKSPSKYALWAIGSKSINSKGIIFSFNKHNEPIIISKEPMAIYPFDESEAIVALRSNNPIDNVELARTTNSGFSFNTLDMSFKNINDIHFFNKMNGVVIGNDKDNNIKVKTSDDGGISWVEQNNNDLNVIDSIVHYAYKNNAAVLLTKSGNIFYSDSIAQKWDKLKKYNNLNKDKIVILSSSNTLGVITQDSSETKFIFSNDLGEIWEDRTFVLPNKIIKAFFLENTEFIYCILESGQIIYTENYFKSWSYILNNESKYEPLQLSVENIDSCGLRIWQLNSNLYFSDVDNVNPSAKRVLAIAGTNTLSFDTVKINQTSQTKTIFANNSGNGIVDKLIYRFAASSEGAFIIDKTFPKYFAPCILYDAKIRFAPTRSGIYYDTLTIESSNASNNIQYFLSAYCDDPSVIKEDSLPFSVIYPNPAMDYILLNLDGILNFEIIGIDGKIIKQYKNYKSHEKIDISNLPIGLYFIKVSYLNNIKIAKFLVIK